MGELDWVSLRELYVLVISEYDGWAGVEWEDRGLVRGIGTNFFDSCFPTHQC